MISLIVIITQKQSLRFVIFVVMTFLLSTTMSSCHKKDKGFISDINIVQIAKNYQNYDPFDGDSVSFPADCKRLMEYWKQPCLELAPNIEYYLDSIEKITGLPNWNEDEWTAKNIHRAVHELRRYQNL